MIINFDCGYVASEITIEKLVSGGWKVTPDDSKFKYHTEFSKDFNTANPQKDAMFDIEKLLGIDVIE